MKHQTQTKTANRNEDGFAAIIVTLIIMAILVLITIGFVRTVTREQRSALDRQLSTQAFYAAETGVNDASKLLAEGNITDRKESCDVSGSEWNNSIDSEVEYTCVLVDPEPPSLVYDAIDDQVKPIFLSAVDDDGDISNVQSIDIAWEADSPPSSLNPEPGIDFPVEFETNAPAPVLRVSLTPLSDVSRQALVENTMTFFLRPSSDSDGPSSSFVGGSGNESNQGQIIRVECDYDSEDDRACTHTINNMGGANYLMTVRAMYGTASLYIKGSDSSGDTVRFANQQAIVDATGRASDVLRRIQVRVTLRETFDYPGFAMSGNICKPYEVWPGDGETTGNFNSADDCDIQ